MFLQNLQTNKKSNINFNVHPEDVKHDSLIQKYLKSGAINQSTDSKTMVFVRELGFFECIKSFFQIINEAIFVYMGKGDKKTEKDLDVSWQLLKAKKWVRILGAPPGKSKAVLKNLGIIPREYLAKQIVNPKILNECSLIECPRDEVLGLQSKVQKVVNKHPVLKLNNLKDDLFPKHKIVCGDFSYFVSNTFYLKTQNIAVVALIKVGDKVYPRIFYQSKSQGTWRSMPAATNDGFQFIRLGKGFNENDTQLPIKINLELHKLELPKKKAPGPFHGDTMELLNMVENNHDLTEIYEDNVKIKNKIKLNEGAKHSFEKSGLWVPNPPDPTSIKMPEDKAFLPNFKNGAVETYQLQLKEYGQVTAHIFESVNKDLNYLFYEASDGRAFLASVDQVNDNALNAYGIFEECFDLMHIDAPLLEYWKQIPEGYEPISYVGKNNYEATGYTNNWNYVRELEIIKQYYQERNIPIPEKV